MTGVTLVYPSDHNHLARNVCQGQDEYICSKLSRVRTASRSRPVHRCIAASQLQPKLSERHMPRALTTSANTSRVLVTTSTILTTSPFLASPRTQARLWRCVFTPDSLRNIARRPHPPARNTTNVAPRHKRRTSSYERTQQ